VKEKKRLRICIFTDLYSFDPSYSVSNVVMDQCLMLLRHGYSFSVITRKVFPKDDIQDTPEFSIRPILPNIRCDWEPLSGAAFNQRVKMAVSAIKPVLLQYDLVITHDIMALPYLLPFNAAIREIQKACPSIKWLHWIHSHPVGLYKEKKYPISLLHQDMENSTFVTPAATLKSSLSKHFSLPLERVAAVPNTRDPRTVYSMSENLAQLLEVSDFVLSDVRCIYPVMDLGRAASKKVETTIGVLEGLKEVGHTVKLIICDAHSGDLGYRIKKKLLKESKLSRNELIFSSDNGFPVGVDRASIMTLFQLSNVFIMPSLYEACSLVALEAALTGNVLVFNGASRELRAIGGKNAIFTNFEKLKEDLGERPAYYKIAEKISKKILKNHVLQAQNEVLHQHGVDFVFRNHLEPLLKKTLSHEKNKKKRKNP
jgi:hypothetical protein